MESILLNGRSYRVPTRPTVVICADGCDPAYIEAGLEAGVLPTIAGWREAGFYALADAVMPTFTNPNNLSIVTGAPPALHGISGNFALDRASGAEIMMTDPEMVHGETILGLMSKAGVPTAAVTAKDKLRRMLGRGLDIGPASGHGGICFSSEEADRCTLAEHGIEGVERLVGRATPDMYSADLLALRARLRDPPRRGAPRAAPLSRPCRITCSTATAPRSPKPWRSTAPSTTASRGLASWAASSR